MDTNQNPQAADAPRTRDRFSSRVVAVGAALGLTLAGLGIAGAQTVSSTTTTSPNGSAAHSASEGHRCHGFHRAGVKPSLAVAAATIGISEDELRTALRSGQSIAQVAQSENVDVKKVVDALVAEARKRLAEKVAAGQLTQARADEISSTLEERITAHVNRTRHPGGKFGHRGPRGGSAPTAAPTNA